MANFDVASIAVKMLAPNNEIITDDKGLPSIMVKIPKFKVSDVIDGGSSATHPAFIVDGVEVPYIYISKYQNIVHDGRAYSLPGEDPQNLINFDTARNYCESKGVGWHLMTNAEWAAIALWCKKNGHMPNGNNKYGKDANEDNYKAIEVSKDSNYPDQIAKIATGTGPLSWSHDNTLAGIWDLNGNVWEWVSGYRTVDGEIQILENNNAANPNNSVNETSGFWKAILPNGSLVAPGTTGTLKWDYTEAPREDTSIYPFLLNTVIQHRQTVNTTYGRNEIESLSAASGVNIPDILKELALWPVDSSSYGDDCIYMRNVGERVGLRGGSWGNGKRAGVFAFDAYHARSLTGATFGFRAAYIPNIG